MPRCCHFVVKIKYQILFHIHTQTLVQLRINQFMATVYKTPREKYDIGGRNTRYMSHRQIDQIRI